MSIFKPSIPTLDDIAGRINAKQYRTVIINAQPYIARGQGNTKTPYYNNVIKRVIAAGYVLFGHGMVIQFSEDKFKKDEIITKVYMEQS